MSGLALRGVTHRYSRAGDVVLADVDLEVTDREMVAVLGPSGTGKSTLLRVAAGLVAPVSGTVRLGGEDVTARPTERRDLTVMFQRPHLFDHLDVRDNVAFGPRTQGLSRREARTRAQRYLALVQLGDAARRRPAELSGGQQQRVALARALACERGVLLLDEPFSSLDPVLRGQMHDLLATVRAELSPTVLMVTHDLDEASLADRVAVLESGRLQQVAPAADLYARPATLAVARLVGGAHEVPGEVVDGVHHSAYGKVRLAPDCEVRGPAVALLRREQLRIVPAADLGADSGESAPFRRRGVVERTRLAGPRVTAVVRCEDGPDRVDVELKPGRTVERGEDVVVQPAAGVRPWAISSVPPSTLRGN
ncbi:ABC transporter ATP-binding protein [Nocardioidaceae bacterium]|nr:ABC transporter ATP-binding protein [Nocardioidaceae bacterium]